MDRIKTRRMTGGAVAADSQGLTYRQASGTAVSVVTGAAGIMHLRIARIGERRRIAVAVAATRRINPDQDAVIRRIGRVSGFPAIRMACLAVAASGEVLAYSAAEKGAIRRVMAVRAVLQVRGRGRSHQRVLVTALTVISTGRGHQRTVVGWIGQMEA